MRIDRDAAPVVDHGDESVGMELHIDPVRVTGERLVHGVVDDFCKQMMQRLLVGAADIHAGTPPHRLKTFENLDVARRVALAGDCRLGARRRRGSAALRSARNLE